MVKRAFLHIPSYSPEYKNHGARGGAGPLTSAAHRPERSMRNVARRGEMHQSYCRDAHRGGRSVCGARGGHRRRGLHRLVRPQPRDSSSGTCLKLLLVAVSGCGGFFGGLGDCDGSTCLKLLLVAVSGCGGFFGGLGDCDGSRNVAGAACVRGALPGGAGGFGWGGDHPGRCRYHTECLEH
jgi:hypothetical protein